MGESRSIVIIPARKGSKRLPDKNILPLNKIPLVEHSINYALVNNHLVDDIYVSTDDERVKEIGVKKQVKIIDRPKHLSGDIIETVSVLKHALLEINANNTDDVILLQPTNPLRPKKLLEGAYSIYKKGNYDSLITVTRNYQKLGKIQDNKFLPFNYKIGQRSQDLEPLYFENGLLYITKVSSILNEKILAKNHFSYIVDHPYAHIDIDTLQDFRFANYLINQSLNN